MSRFVLTAQLQLQAPNNVRQVVQQIQSQLNGVSVNVQVQNASQAQRQIQQVAQATNQATTAAERMGKAFALSIRRFAAFSIATRAVGLFTSTLSDAVQTSIDFERQLIKVSQVTGKSIGQLRGLTKQITDLSTGFGVASSDLLNVSTILAQAGLSAEETSVALKTLAKSALAPNFDSITETAEGAIAVLAQFGEGVGALEKQLGSINAVAGAFAVEASDLIDVIRRTGGVFKASGGDLNELLALFTSVRATTRESAESIGTGLRTIFTRIQRPKTIEFLKQFGVELVDLNGKFVGPYEAIKRLSEALSGLGEGDTTFIRIAEELGGFRQIGKVLPLLQQFSTAQSALNVAMKAGDSLTQDAASAQAALAVRIMKVKEEFLALIRSITETSTFQVMANTALSLASALIKIGDSIKPLLPMLAALAAFKLVKGMGGFLGGMMNGAASGRAYNKGGKVLGFARGGLVPGSGNGDTVPAMLAPGEFVIRKSSVNKMGAGTLAAMNENRFATGGKNPTGAELNRQLTASGRQVVAGKEYKAGDYGSISLVENISDDINAQLGINKGLYGAVFLEPLAQGQLLNGKLDSNQIAKKIKTSNSYKSLQLLSKKDPAANSLLEGEIQEIIAVANKPSSGFDISLGSLSSASAENMKNYILQQVSDSVQASAQMINSELGVKGAPEQARILKSSGIEATVGNIFEAAVTSASNKEPFMGRDASSDFDYPSGIGTTIGSKFGISPSAYSKPSDAKNFLNQDNIKSLNKKVANFETENAIQLIDQSIIRTLGEVKAKQSKDNLSLSEAFKRKKHLGGMIHKFATGGGVGTDTVPALLTPGEFVVNRSSAQSIGYGNLNRMNKVGKYAKGGVVQHFATGTSGTGAKSVVSDFNIPGFDVKAPTMLNKIIGKLTGTFSVTGATIDDANKQFRVLKAVVPNLSKSLVDYGNTNNISNKEMSQLSVAYSKLVMQMLRQGASSADIEANAQHYIDALKSGAKATLSPPPVPSAAQSPARLSQTVEGVVPGFSKSLAANQIAWNRSTAEQDKLTSKIVENIAKWQSQGKSVDEMRGALEKFKDKLDRSTKRVNDLFPPSTRTKNKYAQEALKNVKLDTGIGFRSSAEEALGTGRSKAEVAAERKAAMQAAGFTRGSERTKAILSGSQSTAPMTVADTIAAARGKSTSTSTSTTAGGSGPSGKPQGGGIGNMMGDNKMMALSMASSIAQGFLPAVDESSSAMLKMTHNLLGLVTTVASVGFALEAFGLKLNAQNITGALGGIGSLFKGGGLAAMAGKAGAGAGMMANSAVIGMGGSATTAANIGAATKVFTSAITKIAAPIAATAATFYALKTGGDMLVEAWAGYGQKLKEAIDKGNIDKAREVGTNQQVAKNNVTVGAGAAAGAVGGAMIGTAIMPVFGTIAGGIIGAALGGLAAFTSNELPEYAGALAAAQAAQVDAQNKLTKATEESGKALEEYSKGTKSGLDVIKTFGAATQAVAKSRAETNKANELGLKDRGGISGALGIGAASRLKDSEQRTKAQNKLEEKTLNAAMPGLNALGRDVALAGGSFQDLEAKINEVNPELFNIIMRQGSVELRKNFDNIAKETERAKKAFEALNLGLRAPAATAAAASSALSNFTANLEVGSNPVEQSMSTLEASFSEAGQAMNPNDIKSAIGDVASTLEEFGASDKSVAKFKENAEAFSAVSANYNEIFKGVKDDFSAADLRGLNAEEFNEKFAANLDEQLKGAGIGDEARQRLKDVIGDIKLSDDDMKKLRGGDFSVYQKYLDEAGQKTLEESKKIVAETAKINQQLISLTKQRIEAERNLVQAQQEALDLTMEGREIQGKYGGRAVTGEERKNNLLAKSNAEGNRLGLTAMRTGDTGELRRRNAEIRSSFANIESRRSQQGGLQKVAGVEADEAQKDLQKAYKTQVETIRGLIKLEEEQLKITQEKNKLEKDSMESLVKGDIEEFFKKQSAVGATAAIASGDTRLQNFYGADALGMAYQDIQRQQEAGVQSLYGQQLSGPGGLTEAAAGAALSSRGVTDMRAAQVMAGTTGEEEASKARLRELGGMLGETGQVGADMAEMQVQTATINVNSAQLKLEEIKQRGNEVAAKAEKYENAPAVTKARGGLIYASRGIFVPRGTDTVPAMLTPGEFVVNRGAVQRGNNLQILQAMNNGLGSVSNGGGAALMASGGVVRYRANGSSGPEQPSQGMSNFTAALENFNRELSKNVESLKNTNISIKLDSTSVSINLNDGGLLKALTSQVKQEIFNLVKNKLVVGDGGRLKENSGVI